MARLLQRMMSDATARMAQAVPGLQRADSQPETGDGCGGATSERRRDLLLRQVKHEVALLMEVASAGIGAVARNSPVVHSLCSRVESCLLYGLKRRPGFESLLLLQRVAADCPQAAGLRLDGEEGGGGGAWIRRALLSGCLACIVEHLVTNWRRLYEPESIVADACYGPLLASLLVGPCALQFQMPPPPPPPPQPLPPHLQQVRWAAQTSLEGSSSQVDEQLMSEAEDGQLTSACNAEGEAVLHQCVCALLRAGPSAGAREVAISGHLLLLLRTRAGGAPTLRWVPASPAACGNGTLLPAQQPASQLQAPEYSPLQPRRTPPRRPPPPRRASASASAPAAAQSVAVNGFSTPLRDVAFLTCHGASLGFLTRRGPRLAVFLTFASSGQPRRLLRRLEAAGCCLEPPPPPMPPPASKGVATAVSSADEVDATYRLAVADDADLIDSENGEDEGEMGGDDDAICLERAFLSWLAQTRHSRTLRRRLAALVGAGCVGSSAPLRPLTVGLLAPSASRERRLEACRAVYWAGCPRLLRPKAWPLLLGVQAWEATEAERHSVEADLQVRLENCLSEWSPLDVIVREGAKEAATSAGWQRRSRNCSDGGGGQRRREAASEESNVDGTETSTLQASDSDRKFAESSSRISTSRESLLSPASPASNGGVYSGELLGLIASSWSCLENDLARSQLPPPSGRLTEDQFLDRLRTVLCCYAWEHIEIGYSDGFCDLLVPLLSAVEEDWLALACFSRLLSRLRPPQSGVEGTAIDQTGAGQADPRVTALRLLLQTLDPQLNAHLMRRGGGLQRFQRWFLYDFKFEFSPDDVMLIWETTWAASELLNSTTSFSAFVAMAMLQEYRRIILDKDMDLEQIMRFYDEMTDRHNTQRILRWARELVASVIRLSKGRA